MSIDKNILTELHGRRLGLTRQGHLVSNGRVMVSSPLLPGASVVLYDDFVGKAIDTTNDWGSHAGSDGACVGPAIVAAKGGRARLTTGAGASTMAVNGTQIDKALTWEADAGGLLMAVRLKATLVTNLCLYAGFTDQVAALEMPFTIAAGALTSNATDAAGFLFDTAATASTIKCVGVANDVDAAMVDTGLAFAAATDRFLVIEIDANGKAWFYIDGALVAETAGCVTKTIPLTPVVAAFRRTTVSTTVDIDYIHCTQDRA